jgi:hypothetical protein
MTTTRSEADQSHTAIKMGSASAHNLRIIRALGDVEWVLTADTPPQARLSACRSILYDQLSMPMDGPEGIARVFGFLFSHRKGPFTWVIQQLTGIRPAITTIANTERHYQLPIMAARDLGIPGDGDLRGWERRGLMMYGDQIAARVRIQLAPGQIPGGWDGEDFAMIRSGVPCGAVLPGLIRSQRQGVAFWPSDPAASGTATLTGDSGRFGWTSEQVPAALIRQLSNTPSGVTWG